MWHHHNAYFGYIVSSFPSHNIAKVFAAIFLLYFLNFYKFVCCLLVQLRTIFPSPNGIQSQWRSYCLVHLLYWFFFEILFSESIKQKKNISPCITTTTDLFQFGIVVHFTVSILTIYDYDGSMMKQCREVCSCEI